MEASFYHLTSSPLKKALPSLLEKAYENNMRSLVICNAENIKQLDDDLWTFSPTKFLPHGTEKPEIQPVFITDKITDKNANNGRQVLAITNGAEYDGSQSFEKLLDMFDGNSDEQLNAARKRWKLYKDAGYTLRYWKQDEKGAWSEKTAQTKLFTLKNPTIYAITPAP